MTDPIPHTVEIIVRLRPSPESQREKPNASSRKGTVVACGTGKNILLLPTQRSFV